ncbi:MAG TPA: Trp biosynthesis-associated membrane protein [Kineosporiaceae bacterium]|nr:Trp biosynthesis-associated membrane protein [Kineosporiaceae bacterium]
MNPGRTSRLTGRRTVVLLTLLGAGLVLLAGTRTWATVKVDGALPGLTTLTLTGGRAAPALIPVALAAAAGAIVLATSARIARFAVAAGLVLTGAAVAVDAARFAVDPDGAASAAVSANLGLFDDGSSRANGRSAILYGYSDVDFTFWPWVAVVGGGLILLVGVLTTIGGRAWSGPSRRYERAPGPGAVPPGSAVRSDLTEPTGSIAGQRSAPVAAGRPGSSPAETPAATWDALSRGEDPTSSPEEPT